MSTTQLLIAHVVTFSAVPILLALRPWRLSTPLLYSYVAIMSLVGGFLGSFYGLPVVSDAVVPASSLTFGAVVLTILVLLFTTKEPQVLRDALKILLLVIALRMVLVLLATASMRADGVVNPFDTSVGVLDESLPAVWLGGVLQVAELLLLLMACERIKRWRRSVPVHYAWYVLAFILVLALDGVAHPVFVMDAPGPLADVVADGLRANLLVAGAYAVPLGLYLYLFRDRVAQYEATPIPVRDLVRPPNAALMRQIARQQDELTFHATHDTMTGLVNREELLRAINDALVRLDRRDGLLAVAFIDLDDFKLVNDGHGHAAGDAVLVEVGKRIQSCLRTDDVAARLGGDEFCALITGLRNMDVAAAIGQRILHKLAEPVVIERTTTSIHASLGLTFATRDTAAPADVLIRDADLAMYRAKELGKDQIVVYSAELHEQARARAELATEIALAIESGEFVPYYQPQVELDSRRVVGVEALMRWRHPERGLLPPDQFIAQAEGSSSILGMGEQILEQACADTVRWRNVGYASMSVSVNVSTRQLTDPDFVSVVAGALHRSGLPAELLTLEITESSLMSDIHTSLRAIEHLKELGVLVSIDDFGTGFSSLAYLHQLPVDILKIDKSFVERVGDDGGSKGGPLVQSIIGIGDLLDLTVVAEGVETEQQRHTLVEMGCHLGQGFHFSRPVPAVDIDDILMGDQRARGGLWAEARR